MSTLTLELPDAELQQLEHLAHQRGTNLEAFVRELLKRSLLRDEESDVTKDPIYAIRAHETEAPPDLSQRVDHYLYGAGEP